ncbi:MAG: TIGR02453 family protein [Bacteroidetes bacterium MedPE-SWsnd-G1]|nr:MAG: TIGR02453 family protein [Bacteroidetes bacterium MedPE-SWsnd-G1]
MKAIQSSTLDFLKKLNKNNNRDWFTDNKTAFQEEQIKFVNFADDLLVEMNKIDNIETVSGKKSVFRIYRDVRFSKDKTPYKTHFSGSFKRATEQLRGGYYYHIEPGNSFIGGGFWGPNAKDLLRIRKELANDAIELREIINSESFIKTFGTLDGDRLKTAPRGFDKNHPDLDLLQLKQFIIHKKFSDKEVLSQDFPKKVIETFMAMRPFFDFMSSVLTTDENGVPLYQ